MRRSAAALCALVLAGGAGAALAAPVGQTQATTVDASAGLRDPHGRLTLRLTVWYPAEAKAPMQPITIGPPGAPLFEGGRAAADAPWADGPLHALIVVSHGFGGSARQMAWIGTALAAKGYVVVAVDHPGQNSEDGITPAAAVLPWQRADDIRAALDWALVQPNVELHVDPRRIGFLGFSQGGYTGLELVGARSDIDRFQRFCASTPADAICKPQAETPGSDPVSMIAYARSRPELAPSLAQAGDDRTDTRIKAAFLIAPAPVQLLDPASLRAIRTPVELMLGEQDPVAPPRTNGLEAASEIPGAELRTLPGVGHYDFLDDCTAAGRAQFPGFCPPGGVPQAQTHAQAIAAAEAFFARTLRPAPAGR